MINEINIISTILGVNPLLLIIVLIWSLIWKGFALWKAGRLNQPIWFVLILIIHTMGILEILYIFLFSKIKLESKKNNYRKKKR